MLQQSPVRWRCRMVEFVDDHDIKRVRVNVVEIDLCKRLNRGEYVSSLFGSMAIDEQLAE
jgi:hypothetical protein